MLMNKKLSGNLPLQDKIENPFRYNANMKWSWKRWSGQNISLLCMLFFWDRKLSCTTVIILRLFTNMNLAQILDICRVLEDFQICQIFCLKIVSSNRKLQYISLCSTEHMWCQQEQSIANYGQNDPYMELCLAGTTIKLVEYPIHVCEKKVSGSLYMF